MVYQIFFLSKKLGIEEESMNSMFLLCQFALAEHTNLLIHRNLYHLILCSAYAVAKAKGVDTPFYKILTAFKELNNLEKDDYEQLSEQIHMGDRDDADIITFYNEEFLKRTKPFVAQIKYESNDRM
jgi:hypothetical protein